MPEAIYSSPDLTVFHLRKNFLGQPFLREGHHYEVVFDRNRSSTEAMTLHFQEGVVSQNGINGLTTEALLAICHHRITKLNEAVPCLENEQALVCIKDALRALETRTRSRIERGVESTETP